MRFPKVVLRLLFCLNVICRSVLCLSAISAAALPAGFIPQDNIASVSGTVADGSSKPIPGATVTIKEAGGAIQNARTDSKGKFWIGGLGVGTYTIIVRAKGFKNFEVAGIPLAEEIPFRWMC